LTNLVLYEIILIETIEKGFKNMTNIPTFPAPSASVVEMATGKRARLRAARQWINEARATLADGSVVAPSTRLAMNVMKSIVDGMPAVDVAVQDGEWQYAFRVNAAIEADKLRSERFQAFMAEDQPSEVGIGVCDSCGLVGASVRNHYAPDGMGFPTLVFQNCIDGCK